MAKRTTRTERTELRAPATRAPYRRAKTPSAPPPSLDLPMPMPTATVEAVPAAMPPTPAAMPPVPAPRPAAVEPAPAPGQAVLPPAPVEPAAPPPPVAALAPERLGPDLAALTGVATRALGFAAAVLAELPAPTELVHRDPSAAEPPPGPAPRGDARSLRSDGQFALIYRAGSALVSRRGKLGEHGAWRVVEYPTAAQAAHAYAAECSRLQAQGFRDVV